MNTTSANSTTEKTTTDSGSGEAPGRLDVLGGVADYSGSLVLQMPIRATTRVTIAPHENDRLQIVSVQEGKTILALQELQPLVKATVDASAMRAWMDDRQVPSWARYPVGCFLLFCQAMSWWPPGGLSFHIESDVPTSMGLSSSAALEVATLRALEKTAGQSFTGTALARLAQQAENEIVGAPCGLMDQLASSHGVRGALLPILCRPDILDEPVSLPPDAVIAGWPSGVQHAVSASPYATARAASFMGKKIIETVLARKLAHVTELAPSALRGMDEATLPSLLSGAEFLSRHGGVDDTLSVIEPDMVYPVRAAVSFPVEENFRVQLAVQLLHAVTPDNRQAILRVLGEFMLQAHEGYSSSGLGRPQTDAMVKAVCDLGPEGGFYGARVSGGGSGGTVVVLLEQDALPELDALSKTISFNPAGPLPLVL